MRGAIAICAGALLLGACGDAAVGGSYRGEPLFTVSGWVHVASVASDLAVDAVQRGRLRMAVLWAAPDGVDTRFDVVTSVSERVEASGLFPARYELALFAPPAPNLVHAAGDFGGIAVGVLVAFLDGDDDGHWDAGDERLVGAVMGSAVVYSPAGADGPATATRFPAGYTLANVNADPGSCGDTGQAELVYAGTAEANLTVDMTFPYEAALDLDCDGEPREWLAFCPPLDWVREQCRESGVDGGDPGMCDLCQSFLPPDGADVDACDAWLWRCHELMATVDCLPEWTRCRDAAGDPTCTDHDPVCICHVKFKGCLDNNVDQDLCTAIHGECIAGLPY